ncbi:hypothetical protein BBO99_00009016 [Phytophthora kernoviae]|uniref:Major facilitator superfamily (MFS) profile domain-containing protein n=2 Tax=Phytophthora kernoviae TaxID=325452 RepID=A0A3R7KF35_9STRA|nr:hypothetical protein G195_010148 [Phytophthora kernoviae 00238/432]KAG2508614.1 hypothetical protein JM16_008214 [Phytophthora kernoviae]KAG2514603.1 hypothetical protein JM18_008293 [Phytophthora kernoviae]RLN13816.1 hypothetical protein BBI17_005343 [Phytophthora kernoviae]RLN74265.1 hypothetical protein BBO99_00009016 [Phytophthora kernoviae]
MKSRGENVRGAAFPALSRKNVVNLFSGQHFGLLISTLFAGMMTTCLKRGVLPLIERELRLQEYQMNAAGVLTTMPWSYCFIWGLVSDAVPILGSRRKSYIVLDLLKQNTSLINGYIFLLMLANFGCILAIFIGETYVIAQTRRERLTTRGTALGTLLLVQYIGEFIAQFLADFVIFHISEVGITPLVTLRQVMLFCVFYAIVPLMALSICFVEDDDPVAIDVERDRLNRVSIYPVDSQTSAEGLERAYQTAGTWFQRLKLALRGHWIRLRNALSRESTSRIACFLVGFIFISEFSLTYPTTRLEIWCGMTDKAGSMSNVLMQVFSVVPVVVWKFAFLNVDWRWCIFTSFVVVTMIPQLLYYMIATLNASTRDVNIYAVVSALTGFIRSSIVVLELAITAEVAPVGGEGAFVGIVVSMGTSMRLLANTISNALGSLFTNPGGYGITHDADQMQVAFALVLSHSIQILGLVALVFLPKQKRELQRLHRFGKQHGKRTMWWILGSLIFAFVICSVFNGLAISSDTSCLRIVGGSGCR